MHLILPQKIVTKSKLFSIKKYIGCCKKALKSCELDAEKVFKDFENIKIWEYDSESFLHIAAKNFSIFKDDKEIIDSELQKLLIKSKLKSLKSSKNVQEIQKQLQTNFNLYLQGHTSYIYSVAVTSDNKYILSGSDDGTIRIWNLIEKRQAGVLEGHWSKVTTVAITTDYKYIISGSSDRSIIVWNFINKRQEFPLQGHLEGVTSVAVTSDNKYIISGSEDKTIRIWNFLEKSQETVLQEHLDWVTSVSVTNDNKYIISGSKDKTLRIWNLFEKGQETVFQGHSKEVTIVAVTSDYKYVISGSRDETIRIWNLFEQRQETFLELNASVSFLEVNNEHSLTFSLNNGQTNIVDLKLLVHF